MTFTIETSGLELRYLRHSDYRPLWATDPPERTGAMTWRSAARSTQRWTARSTPEVLTCRRQRSGQPVPSSQPGDADEGALRIGEVSDDKPARRTVALRLVAQNVSSA